ncbi:hypothetical protein KQ939_08895 [Planococcus sp. CP5-4]|nr:MULTISPECIES: hypothetical protein [unclassified Planococcus (in: firmicutes)]MBU9675046.1 hypothetical protein [Planococcus sp. CP5-4_YE]MBV0910396.1 hypothetical protein [Planococcus sp. CP5-4_UN]MBW6063828.1 hypothetical protein [Planococcus sp. CP5-4]
MPGWFTDFREALTAKIKCLGMSTFTVVKYMAMGLIPLYIFYLFMN